MTPTQSLVSAALLVASMLCPSAHATEAAETDARPMKETASVSVAGIVTADDVAAIIKQLSPKFTDDEPLRVVESGPNRLGVFVVRRPKATGPAQILPDGAVKVGEGLQLTQVSGIIRIVEGAGTFVSGGTLVDAITMRADDPDAQVIGPGIRGRAILNGQSRRVSAGDMVIVPAGVAHGFSEIEKPITYLVFRVDAGRTLPLK